MTDSTGQDVRYWLTPTGCAAAGGHRADLDEHHCRLCGAAIARQPR